MELSQRLGNFAYLAVSNANLGNVHLKAGTWDEAREHYDRALTSYVQIGRDAGVARMRTGLAIIGVITPVAVFTGAGLNYVLHYFGIQF